MLSLTGGVIAFTFSGCVMAFAFSGCVIVFTFSGCGTPRLRAPLGSTGVQRVAVEFRLAHRDVDDLRNGLNNFLGVLDLRHVDLYDLWWRLARDVLQVRQQLLPAVVLCGRSSCSSSSSSSGG